jgi:hypothetical protein
MIVARSRIISRRIAVRDIATIRIAPMQRTRSQESIGQGQVCLVPLGEMYRSGLPAMLADERRETMKRRIIAMAYRGYIDATEDEVHRPAIHGQRAIDTYVDSAPLSFAPANFQHGVLLARDIGRQADAAHATSMTRIYDVPTVALVLLREHDYVTERGLVTIARESVNSTVRDWPACLEVWFAPSGNCRCLLTWWTSRMMYLLQTWTSSHKPDSGARLITDYALEMVPFLATTAKRSSSLRRYIDPEWRTRAYR